MLPNFFVVGAPRCGTTSLYYYLKEHPEVYMSLVKEPHFFAFIDQEPDFSGPFDRAQNKQIITSLEEYKQLFADVEWEKAVGECSTSYLYFPEAAAAIKTYVPEAKIIILLRNPVARTYSHYVQAVMIGHESLSFEKALRNQDRRLEMNWRWHYQYVAQSMYSSQIGRYFDAFGCHNVKVYLFEDFVQQTTQIIEDLLNFLEVDSDISLEVRRQYNASGMPRSQSVHRVGICLARHFPGRLRSLMYRLLFTWNLKKPSPISEEIRGYLKSVFHDDVIKTQELIGRDLTSWL